MRHRRAGTVDGVITVGGRGTVYCFWQAGTVGSDIVWQCIGDEDRIGLINFVR